MAAKLSESKYGRSAIKKWNEVVFKGIRANRSSKVASHDLDGFTKFLEQMDQEAEEESESDSEQEEVGSDEEMQVEKEGQVEQQSASQTGE